MRISFAVVVFPLLLSVFCAPLAAQTNPVPFVNNPLVPATAVPGGPAFTLTVNGAGFVSGAMVNWNGSALTPTVVGSTRLTVSIPASVLVMVGTIPVTVSNPAPGGGVSNVVLFEITTASTSLAFTRTETDFPILGASTISAPSALAVGYL